MTTTVAVRSRLSRAEWSVLALLVFSVFVNYADRVNLSVAAPPLKGELGLSEYELGKLLSAFFWTYAGFQLFGIAGWVVDRFHVGWVLGIAYFLWSGATAITGMVTGFTTLFALRLLLGMGEAVVYPAYSKILACNFPEHHRGLANALIDAGSKLGPALGTLAGGVLIGRYGWRAFFIAMGLGAMVWLIPWSIWRPRDAAIGSAVAREAPGLVEILGQRSAWGTFFGLFCCNYYWYFLLTWLPFYLVRERGFSMQKMALFGSLAYLTIAGAAVVGGYVSDRWIAAGGTPTRVRKTFTGGGLALASIILPVSIIRNENLAMALLLAGCYAFGTFCSNHWAITQTLAGPRAAGKWTGFENGVGNLAGVVAPWLTGALRTWTGSFYIAFVMAAAIALTGAAMYVFVIGPVAPVAWRRRN